MIEIFLYTILLYSVANILIYGSIFQWFRDILFVFGQGDYSLYKLFTCMMCLPTWLGFTYSLIIYYFRLPNKLLVFNQYLDFNYVSLNIFMYGVLTSGLVYITNTIVEFFERD